MPFPNGWIRRAPPLPALGSLCDLCVLLWLNHLICGRGDVFFRGQHTAFSALHHFTLRRKLQALAPGLTPPAVLEKFAGIQMADIHSPTTDGRKLIFRRYTKPEADEAMLLQ